MRAGGGSSPASVAAMDNNTFVVQPNHTVTFDVEDAVACDGSVSGWTTGIAGITIEGHATTPGTLQASTTNNNANRVYHLPIKSGSAIVGTALAALGNLLAGTAETAYPTGCIFVINQYGTPTTPATINAANLNVKLYCAPPINTTYKLAYPARAANVTDLACVNSTTVTSATAVFTAADQGQTMTIASGTNFISGDYTINTVSNATTIILSAKPVTNGTTGSAGVWTCSTDLRVTVDPSAETQGWIPGGTVDVNQWSTGSAVRTKATLHGTTPVGSYKLTLSAPLGAAKAANSLVVATQRNVMCQFNNANTTGFLSGGAAGQVVLNCAIRQTNASIQGIGIRLGTGHSIQGTCVISGCSAGSSSGTAFTFAGAFVISGCTNAITSGTGMLLQGTGVITGCSTALNLSVQCTVQESVAISGCDTGVYSGVGHTLQGTMSISGCTTGLSAPLGWVMQGSATITGCSEAVSGGVLLLRGVTLGGALANGNDVRWSGSVLGESATLGSSVQVSAPVQTGPDAFNSIVLWNNGGTAKSYPKFWCAGGRGDTYVGSPVGTPPWPNAGFPELGWMTFFQPTGQSPALPCWLDFREWIDGLASRTWHLWMWKDTLGMTETPRVQLLDPKLDLRTGTPLAQVILDDTTYPTANHWYEVNLAYANPNACARQYILRVRGSHLTTTPLAVNLYFALDQVSPPGAARRGQVVGTTGVF